MLNSLIYNYSPGSKFGLTSKILKSSLMFLFCLMLVFGFTIAPIQAATYTRYEAHSAEGKADLASLQTALAQMRALGCQDPISWYYQGAVHWIPTAQGSITGLQEDNPLCPYYSGFANQDEVVAKLLASWDNCTHAPNQAGQSSMVHFLPWHRLFIYHFEKIVRDLSGDDNFALPYWGYISLFDDALPDAELLTMPVELRDSGSSLYEAARLASLQAGEPINETLAQQFLLDAVEGLRRQSVYLDFDRQIDGAPHGFMHSYIGGAYNGETFFNSIYNRDNENGLMANVPSAGFDPVFWLHHSNIDRLWAQWTNETGVLVTEQELAQVSWPYQFFEPDGTIKGYTMPEVSDITYDLDYNYDDVPTLKPESILTPPSNRSRLIAQAQKTLLGVQQVQETVDADHLLKQTIPLGTNLVNRIASFRSSNNARVAPFSQPHYTLEVKVTYTGRPTGIYEVYLNLPDNENTMRTENAMKDIKTYFAGGISFFVLESDRPTTKTFQFDVTNELLLQSQSRRGIDPNKVSISIRKQGGSEDDDVKIESIALFLQE